MVRAQVVAFLQQLGIDQPIESYARPYAAVATDLATGRKIWLQSGPIHDAVRASIALPGILSPARIDRRQSRRRLAGTTLHRT
jgi:NTE family protein